MLSYIIVYSFALGFGFMLATLEMVHPATTGLSFLVGWRTLVVFLVTFLATLPLFHLAMFSEEKKIRRVALGVIVAVAMGAFFYPLRFIPREKLPAVLTGLAFAALAIAIVGAFLLLARHFFERDV